MPRLRDVAHEVRSKNAGPFWVTFDIFFDGPESFARFHDDPALSANTFARLYDTDAAMVKRIPVEMLSMIKISYPRATPQGGRVERDMHSGQQYVPLLDIELQGG
jgi:hypothetical protein